MDFNTKQLQVNGLNFNVIDHGEGQPVLLLHGFPDSGILWRNQIPALADAGLRVIAPDQRGFGETDKPQEVEAYTFDKLLGDVGGILDQLDVSKAHVVGHDWGAFVAWAVGSFMPDRTDKLVILTVSHPETVFSTIRQYEESWYMLFFQNSFAEEVLRRDDWKMFRDWAGDAADFEKYVADLARPGALTGGLNWYRANATPETLFRVSPPIPWPKVKADTLGVWSTGDKFLTEDGFDRTGEYIEGKWRYERFEAATHWLQLDEPAKLNKLLLEFFAA
ncbi:MAG TPA: alpha/beta hydrolase [Dehalococcoidia bacterium]|nr:alpha/beta hydrolase [Dehalococcoidia bacterium]